MGAGQAQSKEYNNIINIIIYNIYLYELSQPAAAAWETIIIISIIIMICCNNIINNIILPSPPPPQPQPQPQPHAAWETIIIKYNNII